MVEPWAHHDSRAITPEASTDEQLLRLWLHGRPATTSNAYAADAERFRAFVGKPLRSVTLGDVQAFSDSLTGLAPATIARRLNVVKSLRSYGYSLGYLPFNVGRAIKPPKLSSVRAERILAEAAVHRLFALESNPRNHALLRLLYAAGLRVSELAGLRWADLQERGEAGQVTVYGKGGKTRAVLLQPPTWRELVELRVDAGQDAPVFRSRNGGHLTARQLERIVLASARRAGLEGAVSPHWLRHAHASHALDRGAPIHLVQATLGHASVATTGKYLHARPTESSSKYLAI